LDYSQYPYLGAVRMKVKEFKPTLDCECNGAYCEPFFTYTVPPKGETRFSFSEGKSYKRNYDRCRLCHHFFSSHDMDLSELYSQDYVNSTYGENGIQRSFDRVNALPPEKSDNVGRVNRIVEFGKKYIHDKLKGRKPTLLDVGSGLCVFPYRMKEAGWVCTAIDPDPRSIAHAKDVVGG